LGSNDRAGHTIVPRGAIPIARLGRHGSGGPIGTVRAHSTHRGARHTELSSRTRRGIVHSRPRQTEVASQAQARARWSSQPSGRPILTRVAGSCAVSISQSSSRAVGTSRTCRTHTSTTWAVLAGGAYRGSAIGAAGDTCVPSFTNSRARGGRQPSGGPKRTRWAKTARCSTCQAVVANTTQ